MNEISCLSSGVCSQPVRPVVYGSPTEEGSADFCLQGAFSPREQARSAQCTIVHKCCSDPRYVLLDICGIPAELRSDYLYR